MPQDLIATATAAADVAVAAGIVSIFALPNWNYKSRLLEERGGKFAFWAAWYMALLGVEAALAVALYFLAGAFKPKWCPGVLDGDLAVMFIMILVTVLLLAHSDDPRG